MSVHLFSILPSLVLSFVTIHALSSILVMHSQRLFTVLFLAGFLADVICVICELHPNIRLVLINPLIHIVLPIAMSVGPLRTRIMRAGVIWMIDPIAELTGFAVAAALGLNLFKLEVSASNLPTLILMYVTALLFYALACEMAIRFFGYREGHPGTGIAPSVLVFLIINTFFSYGMLIRIVGNPNTNEHPYISGVQVLALAACSLAGILFGFFALVAAQRDIVASRTLADSQARMRQIRHVARSVIETAEKRKSLSRLRHDLANQVGVISELAVLGHVDEAQAHLSDLQEEALRLEGGTHG